MTAAAGSATSVQATTTATPATAAAARIPTELSCFERIHMNVNLSFAAYFGGHWMLNALAGYQQTTHLANATICLINGIVGPNPNPQTKVLSIAASIWQFGNITNLCFLKKNVANLCQLIPDESIALLCYHVVNTGHRGATLREDYIKSKVEAAIKSEINSKIAAKVKATKP